MSSEISPRAGTAAHHLPAAAIMVGLFLALLPTTLLAQRFGTDPLAELREPRMAGALIFTDLLVTDRAAGVAGLQDAAVAQDLESAVSLGGRYAVLSTHGGGVVAGLETVVIGRFRLGTHNLVHLSADWRVGVPIELVRGRSALRFTLLHESSHLGDEAVEDYGFRKRDFDHELLALRLAHALPIGRADTLRLYAGVERVLQSVYDDDRGEMMVAGDLARRLSPHLRLRAGCIAARVSVMGTRTRLTCAAGISESWTLSHFSVLLIHSRGAALPGDFFSDDEEVWGVEFRLR